MPPLQKEDGLIAYECPACSYATSVIWPARKEKLTIELRFALQAAPGR